MFRFAHIEMLWLLVLIPIFVAAYIAIVRRKQRQLRAFGDPELLSELMPNVSRVRPAIKFGLLMLALSLLIVAAARPQYGQKEKTVKRQGIEVMFALDISNSMMAEDVAPNRLDRAKQVLSKLIDQMVDDKVGLIDYLRLRERKDVPQYDFAEPDSRARYRNRRCDYDEYSFVWRRRK